MLRYVQLHVFAYVDQNIMYRSECSSSAVLHCSAVSH